MKKIFKNIKIPMLNISGGIERYGSEIKYLNMLRCYVRVAVPLIEKIKTIHNMDLPDYAVVIGKIKTITTDICAGPVQDLAEDLETAANTGNSDYINKNNAELIEVIEYMVNEIREVDKLIS